MSLTVREIRKQFNDNKIDEGIEEVIKKEYKGKEETKVPDLPDTCGITKIQTIDMLFVCLLGTVGDGINNFASMVGISPEKGVGAVLQGAKFFLLKTTKARNAVSLDSKKGGLKLDVFDDSDDLCNPSVLNKMKDIKFLFDIDYDKNDKDEKNFKPKSLDVEQIKALTWLINELTGKGVGSVGTDNENYNIEEKVGEEIKKNKQVIFTGAPGTGKTYSVREYVKKQCAIKNDKGEEQKDENGKLKVDDKQYKFVQFHPSYDYSDFVEGLRPVVLQGSNTNEPTFVRMDGVFKEFCRHIVEETQKPENKDKKYYFIVDEINRADLAKVFGELMFGLEESYRGDANPIQTQYKNLVTYRIIDEEYAGNFLNPLSNEDIGKANPIENDVFKAGFYIPENLYFIGTMNDIDRSVDSMDFALRRRFQWVEIKANVIMESSLKNMLGDNIGDLSNRVKEMNNKISGRFGLSEAYHIGPAYFKKLIIENGTYNDESLKSIFETNVVSILREYTRGRKSNDVEDWIKECRNALLKAPSKAVNGDSNDENAEDDK